VVIEVHRGERLPNCTASRTRAAGVGDRASDIATGQELKRGLRGRVSGLCQPAYMLDIPGGAGKVPIGPQYISSGDGETGAGGIEVRRAKW